MSNLVGLENDLPPRYCVGIDLGTTNCACAYIDTTAANPQIQQFLIPQLVDVNTSEARSTLPSFLYHFPKDHASTTDPFCVGHYARARGAEQPDRQIASAKSWLCHSGVDRQAKLLPWYAADDISQMSPVEASSQYLAHIRREWNRIHSDALLEEQDVVITLPASFDEVARELTVAAAKSAGLPNILLIEEPQAAFYAWLATHQDSWEQSIQSGQTILICDIGGGTTDFTLIRVRSSQQTASSDDLKQKYGLHRVAVGDHLLLGGDNLDAALAAHIETRSSASNQPAFNSRMWDRMRMVCRNAKESLLGENAPQEFSVFVAGGGRKLIDAGQTFSLSADEVQSLLLDGFFPIVPFDSLPEESSTGFREFGLPYAKDPAITKHLAHFLWSHRFAGREQDDPLRSDDKLAARPDWILFNGGVTSSTLIRERILRQINQAYGTSDWQCRELKSESLDLAVSRGAAYFALVKRGLGVGTSPGVRIDARLARAYFLMVQQSPPRVMCVMPASAQTLECYAFTNQVVDIQIGQPVQFPLHYSSTRLSDLAGQVLDFDSDTMLDLPPIQTVLQIANRRKAMTTSAYVESRLSEIGTLQLYLHTATDGTEQSDSGRWKLEFDLRSTVQTNRKHHIGLSEREGYVSDQFISAAKRKLTETFNASSAIPSTKVLLQQLSEVLQQPRNEWAASLLRELWQSLMELDPASRKKPDAEARWLNLLGYFLRPGFGFVADDWRVAQSWRSVQGKLQNRSSVIDAVILWRRIAGGFTTGQQQALYQEHQSNVYKILQGNLSGASPGYAGELVRLLGSLELLDGTTKMRMLHAMFVAAGKDKLQPIQSAVLWAIGRTAARLPLYGPINCVIPAETIESVLPSILKLPRTAPGFIPMIVQISRKTGDRFRDLSPQSMNQVLELLHQNRASDRQILQVQEFLRLDNSETAEILGETLPLGIQLRNV